MVCVTLILKTFEYVHLISFISNKCLDLILVHLTISGGNDRMPSQARACRFWFTTGGISEKSSSTSFILPLFHPTSCSSTHFICPGIGLANHLRVAPYLVGRRG
jgi:hypothetical protein